MNVEKYWDICINTCLIDADMLHQCSIMVFLLYLGIDLLLSLQTVGFCLVCSVVFSANLEQAGWQPEGQIPLSQYITTWLGAFKEFTHCVRSLQTHKSILLLAQPFHSCLLWQHTQRVVSMSREVEEMRRSFEEKLRTFSQAQAQFEQEKRAALEELKAQHRQEIQELLRSHQSQNANYSKDQEKLGQLHKAEVTH